MNHSRTNNATYAAILCILLLLNQSLASASPAPQSALPSQIRTAHSIFLANAGAQTGFPYDSSVAYQQFADDLQAWGRFTLAATPSEADLIFELRSAAPVGGVVVNQGTGGSYRLPELQLTILDPHTQTRLWVLSEPVYQTLSRKDKTDWFTVSVANLTTKVKQLDGDSISAAESAELERVPKAGRHGWVYAVVAAPVVLGVVGGIVIHHEYENSLAEQKASQDAFCEANHIPLSECAGG